MQAEEARRLTPLYWALYRPQRVQGDERELMLFSMPVAGRLIMSAMNQPATILDTCIWLVCVYGLHKMAEASPNMSKVYVWRLRYGDYYGPSSRPHRVAKSPHIY